MKPLSASMRNHLCRHVYPTLTANAPRDLFAKDGQPYYRNQLARKIRGEDNEAYHLVPLKTNARDEILLSGGSTTSVAEGIPQSTSGSLGRVSDNADYRYLDSNDGPSTDYLITSDYTTTTYTGTSVVREAVQTKEPLADPDKGLDAGKLNEPGRDQGINNFSGDAADVLDNVVLTKKDGNVVHEPETR